MFPIVNIIILYNNQSLSFLLLSLPDKYIHLLLHLSLCYMLDVQKFKICCEDRVFLTAAGGAYTNVAQKVSAIKVDLFSFQFLIQ